MERPPYVHAFINRYLSYARLVELFFRIPVSVTLGIYVKGLGDFRIAANNITINRCRTWIYLEFNYNGAQKPVSNKPFVYQTLNISDSARLKIDSNQNLSLTDIIPSLFRSMTVQNFIGQRGRVWKKLSRKSKK